MHPSVNGIGETLALQKLALLFAAISKNYNRRKRLNGKALRYPRAIRVKVASWLRSPVCRGLRAVPQMAMLHQRRACDFVLSRKNRTKPCLRRRASSGSPRGRPGRRLPRRSAATAARASSIAAPSAVARGVGRKPKGPSDRSRPRPASINHLVRADRSAGLAPPRLPLRAPGRHDDRRIPAAIRASPSPPGDLVESLAIARIRAEPGRDRRLDRARLSSQSSSLAPSRSQSVHTPAGVDLLLMKSSARWSPTKKAGGRGSGLGAKSSTDQMPEGLFNDDDFMVTGKIPFDKLPCRP